MPRLSFLLPLLSCVAAMIAGCGRSAPPPPAAASTPTTAPTEFMQWSGQRGGTETPGTRVLRTAADWTAFWSEAGREAPQPWADTGQIVVVISVGQKRTGGYSAKVIGSRVENGKIVIEYRETAPGPGAVVTQMLTTPWVAVRLPGSSLPILAQSVSEQGQK